MAELNYAPPVDQLLRLGKPEPWDLWIDYTSKTTLLAEHVPELIRMATDPALIDREEDDAAAWAPLHAWRALGQLRAVDAMEPLLSLLYRIEEDDDDVLGEEMPKVFGQFGIPVLDRLKAFAADAQHNTSARVAAAEGIKHIGLNATQRETCAAALAGLLDRPDMVDETLNAIIVIGLTELHAKQHIGIIERAFAAGRVDERMCGKFSHIRAELGLGPAQATMRPLDPQLLIDDAIDKILPLSSDDEEPQWMKDFLA